ncbi:MAG: hypothetical protein ACR2PZ_11605 [Pseudomonadales bacterium]
MSHPTQLQLSMHADEALPAQEALAIAAHVETCTTCQATLAANRDELRFIASAMLIESPEMTREVVVPKFARPTSLRGFALANLATGLVIWLAQFLWKTIFGEVIMNATTWLTSVYLPDIYTMASATALHYLEEGTAMFDAYLGFVVVSLATLTFFWLLLVYRKERAVVSAFLLMAVVGTVAMPTPVQALELRRDTDVVTIAESETINDTLLVAAETVLIEGVITGDVVAVGQRIDVTGSVEGNLVTFAETVTVRGKVGGFALGGASLYDLREANIGGDLWVAGEKVGIDRETRIGRNASVASEQAAIEGHIQKDLHAIAETVEFSGVLGEDLEAFAERVRLLGQAQVGGNVRFRSGTEDRLHRADGVEVGGEVEFLDMPKELVSRNRYATIEFYLWQIARVIAAFIVGVAFLWFVPGLRSESIDAGLDTLKSAGIGFLALVSVPIMAVLVAFTLVGLPLSLIAIAGWMIALYLAKVVVAAIVGGMVLKKSSSLPLTLLVGLGIVIVAVNLPFLGGIISFVLTIIGLGVLLRYLLDVLSNRGSNDLTPA